METPSSSGIKCWAEEDRPREKLLLKGRHNLSDAELIAILLHTGIPGHSALEISRDILKEVKNDLYTLARLSVQELMVFQGIGKTKAARLIAAMELGRRKKESCSASQPVISCSNDLYQLMIPFLSDLSHEEFWIILLNRANKVILTQKLSMGGISGTVADPKLIFKSAIEHKVSSIILCHNHPSGNLKPSSADLELTKKLSSGARLLDMQVLDHLIFTDTGYVSFADEGWLSL